MMRFAVLAGIAASVLAAIPTESAERGAVRMQAGGATVLRVLEPALPAGGGASFAELDGGARWGVVVTLGRGVDPWPALEALYRSGAEVVSVSLRPRGARLQMTAPPGAGSAIVGRARELKGVVSVVPWSVPVVLNDDSVWVGQGYDTVGHSTPIFDHGVTGTGEIISVYDTGVDPDMCYFEYGPGQWTAAQYLTPPDIGTLTPGNKIVGYYVQPGPATAYDPFYGHGTGVAGCAVGDDYLTPSSPAVGGHDPGDGNAPNAQLVVIDAGDFGWNMESAVGDQGPVFEQAYRAGARIQNHSWAAIEPIYGPLSEDCDQFTWSHEDMLFVQANGNSGEGPDDASLVDPSVAKNVLSVGATTNGDDGDASDLAEFSSRGPTPDGRIKPDVVAPGLLVKTAQSSGSTGDDVCQWAVFSGTSFAAPTAAGWAALVRQYLREGFLPHGSRDPADATRPSAALVKAAVIASAVSLEGIDEQTSLPVDPPPSMNQGWGRPLLEDVLYFAGDAGQTTVLDLRNASGLRTGEASTLPLTVSDPGVPLELVLVWTDPPVSPGTTPSLVNDLDLVVTDPAGTTFLGNAWAGGASTSVGAADRVNNVEAVRIVAPVAGDWTIEVRGADIPGAPGVTASDRQGFALVMTYGACAVSPPMPAMPTLSDSLPGVVVDWAGNGALSYLVERAEGALPAPEDFRLITPDPVVGTSFLDRDVHCGVTYSYRLRGWNGCQLSSASPAATVDRSVGSCGLPPVFAGLSDARPTGVCGQVDLSWEPAASACSCSTGVVYNVWVSDTAPIDPDVTPASFSCVTATTLTVDLAADAGLTHFLVRAEDQVPGGAGACGGVADENLATLSSVPTSPTRRVLFNDHFETGRGQWQTAPFLNELNAWGIDLEPTAVTPDRALVGYEWLWRSDSAAEFDSFIFPSADTLVSFLHTRELEASWDGGVVEISTDLGNNWLDAGPRLVQGRYDDWLLTGPGSTILRPGFTGGTLEPMQESLLWLGDLAGQSVRVRFRMLTDDAQRRERWAIDDFQVLERVCPAAPGDLVAAFVHSAPACDGLAVDLDATATAGGAGPYTFTWDFGDLSPVENGPLASHVYPGPGTYDVTLDVRDAALTVDVITMPVTVVAESPAPDIGNTLLGRRIFIDDVRFQWIEAPSEFAGTEVFWGTARDLSDLDRAGWVPWGTADWRWFDGIQEPGLRLFQVRTRSSCGSLPGP